MSETVKFKVGSTIEGKTVSDSDLIAINKGYADNGNAALGSIYRGEKIIGTTEADKLCITEPLKVTGVTVGNLSDSTSEFPIGTDVMSILKQMLMKELGVSATQPSASLSATTGTSTVEKGTVLSGVTFTATLTDGKYTGVSGYSYSLTAGVSGTGCTWSGVDGTKSGSDKTWKLVADDMTVTSTITVKATIAHSAATNVPVTNFGNDVTSGLITSGSKTTGAITYTPQLKWWVGSSTEKFDDTTWTSAMVRALSLKSDWVTNKTASVTFPAGAKQQVIAIPAGRSFTAKDGSGATITDTFSSVQTVTVICGGTHTESYKVYVAPANAGLAANSAATITLV